MTQANSSARRLVASPGLHPALDEAEADGEDAPACGWFDSSWTLRQGLAVSELPDSDGTVEALWFAELAAAQRHCSEGAADRALVASCRRWSRCSSQRS